MVGNLLLSSWVMIIHVSDEIKLKGFRSMLGDQGGAQRDTRANT